MSVLDDFSLQCKFPFAKSGFMLKILVLTLVSGLCLMAEVAFSQVRTDESLKNRSGDRPEVQNRAGEDRAAIEKVAAYLDKMGRKDVGDKLRADFKSGKIYTSRIGANAEVNPGILGVGRSLALNDSIVMQTGTAKATSEQNVAGWALTIVHEYVHMNQWLPMETSWHETPAWAATIKENGLWIRKTLDEIKFVRQDTSLTPQERAQRLKELRRSLKALHDNFKVTLNEIRDKTAKGELDKDYKWQGVPPSGSSWVEGSTDIDTIQRLAEERVEDGFESNSNQTAPASTGKGMQPIRICNSTPAISSVRAKMYRFAKGKCDTPFSVFETNPLGQQDARTCDSAAVEAGHYCVYVIWEVLRREMHGDLRNAGGTYWVEIDVVENRANNFSFGRPARRASN